MKKLIGYIKRNLTLVAVLFVLFGMLLMAIGSGDMENRFGFRFITLAPIMMLVGYSLVVVSILNKKFN